MSCDATRKSAIINQSYSAIDDGRVQCTFCGQTKKKNVSEQHFHLAKCIEFGESRKDDQDFLRLCVPASVVDKSQKNKDLVRKWAELAGRTPTSSWSDAGRHGTLVQNIINLDTPPETELLPTSSQGSRRMADNKRAKVDEGGAAAKQFAANFINFMNDACSPFHAVSSTKDMLLAAGFERIDECKKWSLKRGGKYFFTRNSTCLIAFAVGGSFLAGNPFTIIGAHTDSPCLRVKPVTCVTKGDALCINTQPYGGGLWHTWFDRDLGLAGRVILRKDNGAMEARNVRINRPIARIPNLAIHLTSGAEREAFTINLHEHAKAILTMDPALIASTTESSNSSIHPALLTLLANEISVPSGEIVDAELQLIDLQPSCFGGANDEFIYSGRLDNLCSSYQATQALIDSSMNIANACNVQMITLFDHEEVGSNSAQGASCSMLMDTLTSINAQFGANEDLMRSLRTSLIVSIDMAHAHHPNYAAKHDTSMAPKINQGLVIKHNCNQRYATNGVSAVMFREFARLANVPIQEFSVRADMGCGSTIGSIVATNTGILTVDVGSPQFSMHSIREMMGSLDVYSGYRHLMAALEHHPAVGAKLHFD